MSDRVSEPAWIALTQEHERRYRQLIELAPDAIVVHDGEHIVFANAAAVRLAGATVPDQLVGQPIEAFLEPPYPKGRPAETGWLCRLDGRNRAAAAGLAPPPRRVEDRG